MDKETINQIKLVCNFMGWGYCYENFVVAHAANTFYTKLLVTDYPLNIDESEPNTVHYDSAYGYKCSLQHHNFLYILDRDKTESYIIPNSLQRECNFNSSWSWLMPVVLKINTMDDFQYSVTIFTMDCKIENQKGEIISICECENDPDRLINSVWKAVVEFIKWYNVTKLIS